MTNFFFTLTPTLFGAWIPTVCLLLVQMIAMWLFPKGGKRAVDTSWYGKRDKAYANLTFVLQAAMIALSVFLPFKSGLWLTVGAIVYLCGAVGMFWAFASYNRGKEGETITGGIYKLSRNPMYMSFILGMTAVTIASASAWMLILVILFALATHGVVLGEERWCAETYADSYLHYKNSTPRYFLFF